VLHNLCLNNAQELAEHKRLVSDHTAAAVAPRSVDRITNRLTPLHSLLSNVQCTGIGKAHAPVVRLHRGR